MGNSVFPKIVPRGGEFHAVGGIDVRDWFAGLALVGILTKGEPALTAERKATLAGHAYDFADAMLKERANDSK